MLQLNGFSTEISGASLTVLKSAISPVQVKETRRKLGNSWFTMFHEGHLYSLAKDENATEGIGDQTLLVLSNHLGLRFVKSMLDQAMRDVFDQYDPVRDRPFTFLAQNKELVGSAAGNIGEMPQLLSSFEIRPKYELEAKLIELRPNELELMLAINLTTRWICTASVVDLSNAGIPLQGIHLVRTNAEPGQRRLIGTFDRIHGNSVVLKESYGEDTEVPAEDVRVEGSKEVFAVCLRRLLGSRYDGFSHAVDNEFGKLCGGAGFDQELQKMEAFLKVKSPVKLHGGVEVTIGDRVRLANEPGYKTIIELPPGKYSFDRSRTKLHQYAWDGLARFGPFDRGSFPTRSPRILLVTPDTVSGKISQALKKFRDGFGSSQKSGYDGFTDTFHLANPVFFPLSVKLLGAEKSEVARIYRAAIEDRLSRDCEFDAAFNILLDEHAGLPDAHNPYLVAKSILLSHGIPVQEARVSTLTADEYPLQFTFRNLATALYAKMGGVPWTVDHGETVDDELVVGIGNAELSGSRFEKRQRHIGITTVFRGDGNYLLSNLSKECKYEDYPAVLRESTVAVLREVKTRNNWQPGQTVRIVFHAFKPLKNVEVADIIASSVKEVGSEQTIEFAFLNVSLDHSFSLLDMAQRGVTKRNQTKGVFVPRRGLSAQVGKYTRLVTTTGPHMVKRANLPLPKPLLIHLHKQSTYRDLSYLSEQVLNFTTLSWRSTLPSEKPVTILYSSLIAELLARMKSVDDWSPAVLNTKLRNSKWFL
ncbi:Piwi domain-containing protein [Roseiconus lacunae]|uniref:Piwi domain-containing protein n=1 Tax=Roseiconus lacunae TaxID=2605694 RepID=UPI0011F347E3|nr:Piwi domain-containing protein [Roseiconus lacunae]